MTAPDADSLKSDLQVFHLVLSSSLHNNHYYNRLHLIFFTSPSADNKDWQLKKDAHLNKFQRINLWNKSEDNQAGITWSWVSKWLDWICVFIMFRRWQCYLPVSVYSWRISTSSVIFLVEKDDHGDNMSKVQIIAEHDDTWCDDEWT